MNPSLSVQCSCTGVSSQCVCMNPSLSVQCSCTGVSSQCVCINPSLSISVYDVLTGCVVSRLSDHDACVRDVSWHPYEANIISSSWDGGVRLWEHRQSHLFDEERERERAPDMEEEEEGETE
uniref:Uncharacterized protein n=1 Tax=Lepisosteus oculatus TaxID=7918 RepID=W5LYJ5_LEPOC